LGINRRDSFGPIEFSKTGRGEKIGLTGGGKVRTGKEKESRFEQDVQKNPRPVEQPAVRRGTRRCGWEGEKRKEKEGEGDTDGPHG